MNRFKHIVLLFTFFLIALSGLQIVFTSAGVTTDPTGDSADPNVDIIEVEVSEDILRISLAQTPVITESTSPLTYNIWVDTNGDPEPDTDTYSHEVFEYVAHFKWYSSGGQWFNDSYLWAFRYYIDESGTKHEGNWYWNKELTQWEPTENDQQIATVNANKISFDITEAINREQPLGSGIVIQAVANAGTGLVVQDIAPNTGWVDEFDDTYVYHPPSEDNTTTSNLLTNCRLVLNSIFLLMIIPIMKVLIMRRNKQY